MHKKLVLTAFLLASVLTGLGACTELKQPPRSDTGGVASPTGPATGPAFQGIPG